MVQNMIFIIFAALMIFILAGAVSAEMKIGYDDEGMPAINIEMAASTSADNPCTNGDVWLGNGSCMNIAEISGGATCETCGNYYVNRTGDTMTGNLDMDGNSITGVGSLVMEGTLTSYDIIPATTDLYSLGDSTHWFKNLFVRSIFANNVTAGNISAKFINSTSIESEVLNSTEINSENVSTGVIKNKGEPIIVILED